MGESGELTAFAAMAKYDYYTHNNAVNCVVSGGLIWRRY